jgi:acetoin utilization protein AcuB
MQVMNWMTPSRVCVDPRENLAKAGALMAAGGFRQLPVVDNGNLIGIVTDRDLRPHVGYLESTLVDAAMTSCPVVIGPSDLVEVAAKLMIQHKIGAIPVVENGRTVGILSTSDLLKALLSVIQATKQIVAQ